MKLLVVSSMTPTSTATHFVEALVRSGHELRVCSDIGGPAVSVVRRGLVDVGALLRELSFEPHGLLFVEGGTMRMLPDTSVAPSLPTVWYAIDTHMDAEKHVRIGRLFDATFVAQNDYVAKLTEEGVRSVEWLPLAFSADDAGEEPAARDLDISYVGSMDAEVHGERMAMIDVLRKLSASTWFGRALPDEMGRIYARSKLVFNRSVNNDLNMRCFEAMGAGAVLLTDRLTGNGVEDLFTDGAHYVSYEGMDDLERKVRELLQDPERCRRIGKAARCAVLAEHTYQHRADQVVWRIETLQKAARPSASDVFAACVSMGLTADALRVAGRAVSSIGGGRFQRALGGAAAPCLNAMGAVADGIDRLRKVATNGRHASS